MRMHAPFVAMLPGLLLMTSRAPGGPADAEPSNWWRAQNELSVRLTDGHTAIAGLVATLSESEPRNGQEAMFSLSAFMRAGMPRESIRALRELKGLDPQLGNEQISGIYYEACDHLEAWGTARALVELFADGVSELELHNRLLRHLLESGWSVEQVDQWLADRPAGRDGFWVKERLRFDMAHQRGEQLLGELEKQVRRKPEDIDGAVRFLDALAYARTGATQGWDVDWMQDVVHPRRATEAERLASRLKGVENWTAAAAFYMEAIELPLTDQEVEELGRMRQVIVSADALRAGFVVQIREALAECLLKQNRSAEAQRWMVEAANIRQKHGYQLNAVLSGRVQAESGQRIIENRIRQEEPASKDDPEYWRRRSEYYRGRKEPIQEEEALKKGLALTTPKPLPEHPGKDFSDLRAFVLSDYAHFLARVQRPSELMILLRNELEQAPADSVSTAMAARLLAFDFPRQLRPDDPVLWNWLSRRPRWAHVEQRLLWEMLQRAPQDSLDACFARAERLTKGTDPSRAGALGWIMNRMHFAARSIPLLEYAVAKAADQELKETAQFTLLESYLDTSDWQRAEAIFPAAAKRLTWREGPEWYARVAVAAAKAGARADAMRIWRQVANLNPSEIRPVDELARTGLSSELQAFYLEMQREIPTSDVPARALKALGPR